MRTEIMLGDNGPDIDYFNSDENGIEILKDTGASLSSLVIDIEADEINYHETTSIKDTKGSWIEGISGVREPYEPFYKNALADVGEYNDEIKEELYQEFLKAKEVSDKIDGECPKCKSGLVLVKWKHGNVFACDSCDFMESERSHNKRLLYVPGQHKNNN